MEEIWKDIEGYEGLYKVSNKGSISSYNKYIEHRGGKRFRKGKIMKPAITPKGYKRIRLSKNGTGKSFMLHRLVAQAFIPNLEGKPQINHIDGNKENNVIDNLEWCTNGENQVHAWKYGLNKGVTGMFKGENNRNAKKIICTTTGEVFNYIKLASKKYEIDRTSISKCCNGKAKFAGRHPITDEKMTWKWY